MEDFSHKWLSLIGLSLLAFTAFLDFTIVNTALPAIQNALHVNVIKLQWITNIFALVGAMFMIVSGKAGDILGRKKVFFIAVGLFGLAALGGGLSDNINWLIFFRALQGLCASAIFTLGVALLPQAFPLEEQTTAVGVYTAITGIGLGIGPFVAGILVSLLSWRWVFFINIPVIIIGFSLCAFYLQKSKPVPVKEQIDWRGVILIILAVGCLVYGMIRGGQYGWDFITPWVLIVISIAAFIILILVESKQEHPLLDLSIFSNKYLLLATLISSMGGLASYVFMFFDPLYLSTIRHLQPFMIGVVLVAMPIMQVVLSFSFPYISKKISVSHLIIIAIIALLIAALIHTTLTIHSNYSYIVIAFLLLGITWGMAVIGGIYMITKHAKPEHVGSVVGTVVTCWNIFGSLFLTTSVVVFHAREKYLLTHFIIERKIPLTKIQITDLQVLLSDPHRAKSILVDFSQTKAHEIYLGFKSAFLGGFHWVAWYITFISFLSLIFSFYLKRK